MVAAPAATSGNSALFALLGAGIAAAASLLAVVIKYYFDDKTERNRYRRDLDKLRLSLEKERAAPAKPTFASSTPASWPRRTRSIGRSWKRGGSAAMGCPTRGTPDGSGMSRAASARPSWRRSGWWRPDPRSAGPTSYGATCGPIRWFGE